MKVKKLLELAEEEFNALIAAGDLLMQIGKALETQEADALSDGVQRIVKALKKAIDGIEIPEEE